MTSREYAVVGNVALVTGAGTGLGQRFAHVLAEAGAQVVIVGRRADKLESVANDLRSRGATCLALPLDLTDARAIPAAIDQCERELGLPGILVNNAGIPDARRAHRMSLELVQAVLDTNLRGPWLLATEVARRLIDADRPGRIVNISSMSAYHYSGEGAALYAVTKAAVSRMTETLAVEWARHNINVNAIAPGAFESEMMDGMVARMGDISKNFPRGRLATADLLDTTLRYLVAPGSEAVTGTVVKVDDGQTHR